MASIGFATLEIIPSLRGVTEAIEKQVEGKVVNVTIEPRVDKKTAQKAGKETGEVVTKEVTAAVRKGDIGKTVGDEITSSAKKSNAGKNAAKVIVDGIADGVKQEMPRGGVGAIIVDGIAEGVKQGIDGVGIGGEVVTTISTGIKSGNLGGAIKDAVIPAITNIGNEIRSSASSWAGDIGNALRSGDIQGATREISDTVQGTTDLIANIGSTFGLQLDGVRDFGTDAATTLSKFGTDVQEAINTASGIKGTFDEVGTILETVLPGKAGTGAAKIAGALGAVAVPAWLLFLVAEDRAGRKWGNGDAVSAMPSPADFTPGVRSNAEILLGPYVGPFIDRTLGLNPPEPDRSRRGQYQAGGYTGMMPADKIAGVVHGGEHVIKASSTRSIENAYPGLLDYLNNNGTLPGYEGGGKVMLGDISGPGITTGEQQSMWDAVRGKFPGAILSSATRTVMTEGHADYHNAGRAIDISGPGMGSIAAWIASNYPDSLELIHSPFGSNIKNGKNVGDGTSYYGAGLMAAHRDHVHWALGKTAKLSQSDVTKTLGADVVSGDSAATSTPGAAESATPSGSFSGVQLASSFSGLAGSAGSSLGDISPVISPDGKTRSLDKIGSAVGQVAAGQVASGLGVLGIGDSPGWLKGISAFASGIKIGGSSSSMGGDAAPISAAPAISAANSALGSVVGGGVQQPAQQTTYNVRTATVEDAFLATQRIEKEKAAATLASY
jgi:hypothetical protein